MAVVVGEACPHPALNQVHGYAAVGRAYAEAVAQALQAGHRICNFSAAHHRLNVMTRRAMTRRIGQKLPSAQTG
jgi:peptidoglycan/xylan/chitin deacetylase (PgdA/CDA1 family)